MPAIGGVSDKATCTVNLLIAICCPYRCIYCKANFLKCLHPDAKPRKGVFLSNLRGNRHNVDLDSALLCLTADDVVQIPSAHDITSKTMAKDAARAISQILIHTEASVIVHTKASLDVAQELATWLIGFAGSPRLVFQITIGTRNNRLAEAVEPYAPSVRERCAALRLLHDLGFCTSVSCTPTLDADFDKTYEWVEPFVSRFFHIGVVRKGSKRTNYSPKHFRNRSLLREAMCWNANYASVFTMAWAVRVLQFAADHSNVLCERDIYDLAGRTMDVTPLQRTREKQCSL